MFLVAEGIEADGNIFIGEYDITAQLYEDQDSSINKKGYISEVRCYESNTKYKRGDYSGYTHTSYDVEREKVEEMIKSIKMDKAKVVESMKSGTGFLKFQFVGSNHLLADEGSGDNCASWSINKLLIAGIDETYEKTKPEKVSGGCVLL